MTEPNTAPRIHAIIPAGGAGTRLWPLSRRSRPKFLLDLTGAGRTLLQGTVARLEPVADSVTVVTGVAHLDAVASQLPQVPAANLLAEPSPRDSMAAIGLAAAVIAARHGREAVVGSFAADQVIADEEAFVEAVRQAATLAQEDWVVTIGIEATGPSTAFGYIHAGEPTTVAGAPDGRVVLGFTEKPDADTAERYLASGSYRWNAGMFVARAGVLLDHLARQRPALAEGIEEIAAAWDTSQRDEVLARVWPGLEKIAIDHAIAEPVAASGGVAVVPASMGWDDVGGFDALAGLVPPRAQGPAAGAAVLDAVTPGGQAGDVEARSSEGALVASTTGRKVTLLGVPGLVVVDTPDALLITTPEHAQEVKGVVDRLREQGRDDLL
ncbi:MAG: mannose-1-phosphate guanylyltransferase [Actinomyces urogenitalis]|uniref:Mannose-1-phosphate guanylyltransferase n=1 Tax=Actinomyces urogenitalis TaxID=103621 RepID=A0A2I1KT81_9ACTO|nr:mannose-1-phosphate guanylyltransferase [Actinomyces urogenitalis]KGE99739.1 mannose-1-phosphate guanylyltransferase [Actinomyces urogenitalis S6-C4]MBS6071137.1 mannose-1-phosphate guanylyltransferase [Actinomyces urogenitalis]MDU0971996.1 mannose-1-phosphate guanylyltransferase [Actinomyces urogenitalis]MDU5426956.1 mannose-1-phosphate guanylyltransferase [Actinomyces urogenitalis]MDU5873618.1 mannose-1-phosphate guanylyltransferase [Actinomyces urogenitalis]